MVLYATAIILQCLHHLHYAGCKRKGCRGCMGCVDGVVKVLDVKFDSESIKAWAENFKQTFMELLNTIPSIMKQLGQSILDGLDVLTGGKITELKNFLSMVSVENNVI